VDFLSDHYIFTNCKRLQIGSFPEFLSKSSEISLQKILESCEPGKDILPDKIDEIYAL